MYNEVISLARRRGFLWKSSEIYGGIAGFYDYAPMGSLLKHNIENIWRDYYLIQEGCLEIESNLINPEEIFKASGHLDEFEDILVECKKCKSAFRADLLIEKYINNPDSLSIEAIEKAISKYKISCQDCKGELSKPYYFNLMFKTYIGASSKRPAYLRPETAQGIFINFSNLYRVARMKLPFGVCQIGKCFRNEISPRQGIIRVREISMAECEYFVNPNDKSHSKFNEIKNEILTLVTNENKELRIGIGEAIKKGIIKNESLGYFIVLTKNFLIDIGIDKEKLRFRQHLKDEMAHYAKDCWDAEILLSIGDESWIEVVGIADRACYDLERHIQFSGENLTAFDKFDEPREIEKEVILANLSKLGPIFKKDAGKVKDLLEKLKIKDVNDKNEVLLNLDEREITVNKDFFEIIKVKEKITGKNIIPNVIEPSYGIDRIFYAVLEHSYYKRMESNYNVLKLKPNVAPIKVGIFPLMSRDKMDKIAKEIEKTLRNAKITTYYDDSGSIGRRYARMDEIGTPYCITIDYQTIEDNTVTIRERDSTSQYRISIDKIVNKVIEYISN